MYSRRVDAASWDLQSSVRTLAAWWTPLPQSARLSVIFWIMRPHRIGQLLQHAG